MLQASSLHKRISSQCLLLPAVGCFSLKAEGEHCCQGCSEPYCVHVGKPWIEMFIGADVGCSQQAAPSR